MPRKKRNGDPCTLPATGQQGLCWAHSPENAATRKRTASRGGKARAAKKVAWIWDAVADVIRKVEEGTLPPDKANCMIRAFHVLIAQRRLELDEEERVHIKPLIEQVELAEAQRKEEKAKEEKAKRKGGYK